LNEEEVLELFMKTRAIHRGHFELSSGYHTDTYYQSAQIFQHPSLAEKVGDEIARIFRDKQVDVVVSPAVGGIILGFAVALSLGCRAIFTEREQGRMTLRRDFSIQKGEKVLIVEDVVTTGDSVREVIDIVRKAGGRIVGLASLLNRGGKGEIAGVHLYSLLTVEHPLYPPGKCPLDKEKIPLVSPGSRRL
jgi:orotate phosphoribosyltransferase